MVFRLYLFHDWLTNILKYTHEKYCLVVQNVGHTFSAEDVTLITSWASLVAQMVENLPAVQETQV